MSYFAKIYPELVESILLNQNLIMELGNVTSRNNNLIKDIIEDFGALNKPIVYNSSVESTTSITDTSLNAPLRPDFMTPRPKNYHPKCSDNDIVLSKKRTYIIAFGEDSLEDERYGQHISNDFFVNNIGHNSTTNSRSNFQNNNVCDYDFVAYYQANRNLFNV
jgi:hypothetical protein